MGKHILLVEIGTEELPPKMLRKFGESFAKNIESEFKIRDVIYEKVLWFASSRRLAIQVINVVFVSYVGSNFISNSTSKVLRNIDEDKDKIIFNKCCFFEGKDITLLLSDIVNNALINLPVSTMMRWEISNEKFIRPVRTVSILLDDKVIVCNFFGISSDRIIRGHHYMGDHEIFLDHAECYQETLFKKGFVVADYEVRKDIIRCQIDDIAKQVGGMVDYSGNLLEEVTGLSEWPIVLIGSFSKDFLYIPQEILLHIMQVQKRYFPLYDCKGQILPYFIFVIDVVSKNNERIIMFHEKFLHLSFSDARFFLNCDSKFLLKEYIPCLHTILFHKKLGNLYDKSIRIKTLSSWFASEIGINIDLVERAAILSKCDLLSSMVSEFPFSQGIMGMYYALRDGESKEVALAQKEQYQPRFSSDKLPSALVSCVISIVDKVDTIVGMFIIGEQPRGNRDPMGLRRAAIGVLRIIIEKRIKINLLSLVEQSLRLYEIVSIDEFMREIINFMYKRLCVLYKRRGYRIDIIQAVLTSTLDNLVDFDDRINAISSFCLLKESKLLFVMYKRIFNILRGISEPFRNKIDLSLFVSQEEIHLANKVLILYRELTLLCDMGRYYDSLNLLLTLYVPVDDFFKNVVVLAQDKNLRWNRLELLNKVWFLLLKIIQTPNHMFS